MRKLRSYSSAWRKNSGEKPPTVSSTVLRTMLAPPSSTHGHRRAFERAVGQHDPPDDRGRLADCDRGSAMHLAIARPIG